MIAFDCPSCRRRVELPAVPSGMFGCPHCDALLDPVPASRIPDPRVLASLQHSKVEHLEDGDA